MIIKQLQGANKQVLVLVVNLLLISCPRFKSPSGFFYHSRACHQAASALVMIFDYTHAVCMLFALTLMAMHGAHIEIA